MRAEGKMLVEMSSGKAVREFARSQHFSRLDRVVDWSVLHTVRGVLSGTAATPTAALAELSGCPIYLPDHDFTRFIRGQFFAYCCHGARNRRF